MATVRKTGSIAAQIEQVKAELQKLACLKIRVGILAGTEGELAKIAYVHEYGFVIKPKSAKNLAIPLHPNAKGKSPRDFTNTFYYQSDKHAFIAQNRGKDEFVLLFLLLPSVTIPERSFIRGGYDAGKSKLDRAMREAALRVAKGQSSAMEAANYVGIAAVTFIQNYFDQIGPPKGKVTLAANPGKTKTLFMSGRLKAAINYEVVSK